MAAALLEAYAGDVHAETELWGFAVIATGTVVVNTGMLGYLYGRLRRSAREIAHRASHDPVTGLPNRMALARHRPRGGVAAVYVVDPDGFRFVNDALGHVAADRLLALLGERVGAHAGPADLVARLGGDEIVLVAAASTTPPGRRRSARSCWTAWPRRRSRSTGRRST